MVTQLDIGTSHPIDRCQICGNANLDPVLFLGFVPPVNTMHDVGRRPDAELRFPLQLLLCSKCSLVQIGYEVAPEILFPESYPYLSGTTRILRDNFRNLAQRCKELFRLGGSDLVIDVGANDGTLLQPFGELGIKTLGIEPSQAADVAMKRGIAMVKDYFSIPVAKSTVSQYGRAAVVTAANVFAHIKNVHDVVEAIKIMLKPDGAFVSESHYLLGLVRDVQYDTIYHEHLRYYSVKSLQALFSTHDFEIFRVERIPTHGGSIRVFAARRGLHPIHASVNEVLVEERDAKLHEISTLEDFRARITRSKLGVMAILKDLKASGARIFGVGAPSRASTLITHVGLDHDILDCIVEVSGSHKLNKYMPGTLIPVVDEERLYREQPEYALLLSWHIADELGQNLRKHGYNGRFIVPLPEPRVD